MEQRTHPRIQLPLLVEVQHPSIGRRRCTARDVSEGGLFVQVSDHSINVGAKLKITALNPNDIDPQPTPTVDMEVKRVDENGIGLSFVNRTSRYLWDSVKRLREELEIGRDYFQVYLAAVAMNERGQLLIVQHHGRWTFPGQYLVVGDSWRNTLSHLLERDLSLHGTHVHRICDMTSSNAEDLPEAAALKIQVLLSVDDSGFAINADAPYRDHRWIARKRDLEEITFAHEQERQLAADALDWYQA